MKRFHLMLTLGVLVAILISSGYYIYNSIASENNECDSITRKLADLGYKIEDGAVPGDAGKPDYVKNLRYIKINNDSIVIVEYTSTEIVKEKVREEKDKLMNPLMDFINEPHLFNKGNLELTYFGTNEKIIGDLTNIFGRPLK